MKYFNAFQIVAAFVAWPYLVAWLATADFPFSEVAVCCTLAIYVVAFFFMFVAVVDKMENP